jgi:hypothetical protein
MTIFWGGEPCFSLTSSLSCVLVLFVSTAQPSCETPDPAAARTERHLAMLAELGEIGMDLAREVRRQALDQTGEAPSAADLALTFSRIARAVRQTVALEAKLAEERQKADADHLRRLAQEASARGRRRKKLIEDAVERAIEAEAHGETAEALLDDLYERLQDPRDDADYADRPIGELIARICKALGVTPDPSVWEDEDWAIEEARLGHGDAPSPPVPRDTPLRCHPGIGQADVRDP